MSGGIPAGPERLSAEVRGDVEAPESIPVSPEGLIAKVGRGCRGAGAGRDETRAARRRDGLGMPRRREVPRARPVHLIAKAGGDVEAPAQVVMRPEPPGAGTGGDAEAPGGTRPGRYT